MNVLNTICVSRFAVISCPTLAIVRSCTFLCTSSQEYSPEWQPVLCKNGKVGVQAAARGRKASVKVRSGTEAKYFIKVKGAKVSWMFHVGERPNRRKTKKR